MSDALTEAVQRAIDRHGGLRAAARALDINWAYLWRLHRGKKRNPTAKILRKLKLRKVEYFEHIGSASAKTGKQGDFT
jgi:hypothetical protein